MNLRLDAAGVQSDDRPGVAAVDGPHDADGIAARAAEAAGAAGACKERIARRIERIETDVADRQRGELVGQRLPIRLLGRVVDAVNAIVIDAVERGVAVGRAPDAAVDRAQEDAGRIRRIDGEILDAAARGVRRVGHAAGADHRLRTLDDPIGYARQIDGQQVALFE